MRTYIPFRKLLTGKLIPLTITGMIMWAGAAANTVANSKPVSTADTMLVQKQENNKKYKVKLYPNATHQVLFFNVNGEEGKVYQLFIFDVEGKLVKQANIRNKETTVLNNINKGTFLYEVFADDERLERGTVIVR